MFLFLNFCIHSTKISVPSQLGSGFAKIVLLLLAYSAYKLPAMVNWLDPVFHFIFSPFPWQIGKTKVFLRAGQMAELDACRSQVLGRSASIIQRKIRSYLAHKHFVLLQFSAIQIQALCRGIQCFLLVLLVKVTF